MGCCGHAGLFLQDGHLVAALFLCFSNPSCSMSGSSFLSVSFPVLFLSPLLPVSPLLFFSLLRSSFLSLRPPPPGTLLGSHKLLGYPRNGSVLTGPVAQWIRHRPTEPGIVGSSPTGVIFDEGVVYSWLQAGETSACPNSGAWFRSTDLWVMSPTR